MSQVLWTTVTVALCLAALILHELGHVAAFTDNGVPVTRLSIGIGRPSLTIGPSRRRPYEIRVTPWLVGAYVLPGGPDDATDKLPFRQAAWIDGAGVIVNIVAALALLAVLAGSAGAWWWAALITAAAVALWVARRSAVLAIVPAGLGAIVLLAVLLASDLRTRQSGGVVGLPALLVSSTPEHAIVTGLAFSLGLAVLNMAPLMPLDGGQIARHLLLAWKGPRAAARVAVFGFAGFVLLMGAALLSDVLHLTR
jgi:membrane-associated protease RseP (regulator of RpoE activity)